MCLASCHFGSDHMTREWVTATIVNNPCSHGPQNGITQNIKIYEHAWVVANNVFINTNAIILVTLWKMVERWICMWFRKTGRSSRPIQVESLIICFGLYHMHLSYQILHGILHLPLTVHRYSAWYSCLTDSCLIIHNPFGWIGWQTPV